MGLSWQKHEQAGSAHHHSVVCLRANDTAHALRCLPDCIKSQVVALLDLEGLPQVLQPGPVYKAAASIACMSQPVKGQNTAPTSAAVELCTSSIREAFRQSQGQSRGSKVVPEDTAEGVLVGDPKHDHAAPIVPVKVNTFCNLHQVTARSAASWSVGPLLGLSSQKTNVAPSPHPQSWPLIIGVP